MEYEKLSDTYSIKKLDQMNLDEVFELCGKNTLYYQYCPPFITKDHVIEDMAALPPGKTKRDKFFLGYFEKENMIAILDLIMGYPDKNTVYIGLFMTDIKIQGQGIGTKIIEEVCDYLNKIDIQRSEQALVKGNTQSEKFWNKNNFEFIRETSSNAAEHVIVAERVLSKKNK